MSDAPRPKVRKAWKTWAIEIAIMAVVFFGVRAWQTRKVVTGPAPALEARLLDGSAVSLAAMRGKPVLVHFWATWCGVCQAEEGNVSGVVPGHQVVTIASQSGTADEVKKALAQRGLAWPVVNDPTGSIAAQWGVQAFPSSFYVSPQGHIRSVEVGYTTRLGMLARLWWAGR